MTTPRSKEAIDRREFLRGSVRCLVMTAIAAATVRTVARGGVRLSGQTCSNQGICPPCPNSGECALPQALSYRDAKTRKPNPATA